MDTSMRRTVVQLTVRRNLRNYGVRASNVFYYFDGQHSTFGICKARLRSESPANQSSDLRCIEVGDTSVLLTWDSSLLAPSSSEMIWTKQHNCDEQVVSPKTCSWSSVWTLRSLKKLAICILVGLRYSYDKSSLTNLIPMDPSEMPDHSPDQRGPRQFRGPQIVISGSRNCPSRKKVYIECGNLICGQGPLENVPPRSLSGDAVPNGKHSWTAALYAEGQFFCSAVLIDQEWVLTAANCVNGLQNTYMVARAGITRKGSMNQNEQFLPIDYMVLHPNYRASSNQQILSVDGDLALLHLSVPAHWNAYVKPVCLATSSPPAKIFIAGWGRVLGSKVYSTGTMVISG